MNSRFTLALATAVALAACTGTLSCREGRSATSSTKKTLATRPSASAAPLKDVLSMANDRVEAARILALPVEPLDARAARGFALPTYTELPDLSYAQMLDRIAKVGATHVSIVSSWDQRTIYHNRIQPNADTTPSDEVLGEVLDHAHELGLKTLLFPIIHIEQRDPGEWRGKMAPTEIERWRASYRDFIVHHARLAAAHHVSILSVGSELSSQESATPFWNQLIDDVRGAFDGELIYSANWDHYDHPQFWSKLDYVGVSSYFEVAKRSDEPIFVVTDRWYKRRAELLAYAHTVGKPLILTEVGYPAIDSAAVKPWDYTARTAPNPNAQLAAFRSLASAWDLPPEQDPDFGGLFIWHGWGHGGDADISYPIWGKSSELLVQEWYRQP